MSLPFIYLLKKKKNVIPHLCYSLRALISTESWLKDRQREKVDNAGRDLGGTWRYSYNGSLNLSLSDY